jgi:hypothetical protein
VVALQQWHIMEESFDALDAAISAVVFFGSAAYLLALLSKAAYGLSLCAAMTGQLGSIALNLSAVSAHFSPLELLADAVAAVSSLGVYLAMMSAPSLVGINHLQQLQTKKRGQLPKGLAKLSNNPGASGSSSISMG